MDARARLAALHQLLLPGGPPELGPGPRPGTLTQSELAGALDKLLPESTVLAPANRQLIRALVLLWHDHLDAAHVIAQDVASPDGSFVHGILHRREPDYGNARYWFRRVGSHPAYVPIAEKAAALPGQGRGLEWRARLLPEGLWDAFAFIDLCEQAARLPSADPQVELLRDIQALESRVLLEHLLA